MRPARSGTTAPSCSRAWSTPRGARGPTSAAGRCRSRCSARSASTCSRCTASPTSSGCSDRPSSGRRWTGTPGRRTRSGWRPTARRTPPGAGSPADLARRRRDARERGQEVELLRLGLDEIGRVDPRPGEDEELRDEARRLEHAEGLRSAALGAYRALGGGRGPTRAGRVTPARHRRGTPWRPTPAWTRCWAGWPRGWARRPPWRRTSSAELGGYLDALDADPDRLAAVHERRAALRALTLQVRR